MHLKILWVGKTRSQPIKSLLEDYLDRIGHLVSCELLEAPDLSKRRGLRGDDLLLAEGKEISKLFSRSYKKVILDERGKEFSSLNFARWLQTEQIQGTKGLEFVIGGPDGLSRRISEQACLKLSLGRMTWTHEMCRVLLLEQIYRALSIMRNIPYHK